MTATPSDPAPPLARRRPRASAKDALLPLDPLRYAPTPTRPVRAKVRVLDTQARVVPHSHPWAQVVFSTAGICRVEAEQHSFIVPPSRAVWVPPGVEHAVTVVERAELRTLYLLETGTGRGPAPLDDGGMGDWTRCRVLEVSPLLRELVPQLASEPGDAVPPAREALLARLVADELARARPVPLGVELPTDKRLRSLCEAVIDDPLRHERLDDWAAEAGASVRTVARLFRSELGTHFGAWRQQVLLARALSMAAQRRPMAHIAAELGYASASAFSAMVRRSVGLPPTQLLAGAAAHPPVASPSPAANRVR
ncbi:MAG: helix-turn-helix transcriptional regulator [Burkholderiaceae bacterium]|nr:helix-turn-helix transcriptional regulator [Rhodoferax sp.]MCP5285531.1 helix-turn-helix transcriptional regulator [Burkholderiaceae bacterium]